MQQQKPWQIKANINRENQHFLWRPHFGPDGPTLGILQYIYIYIYIYIYRKIPKVGPSCPKWGRLRKCWFSLLILAFVCHGFWCCMTIYWAEDDEVFNMNDYIYRHFFHLCMIFKIYHFYERGIIRSNYVLFWKSTLSCHWNKP